MIGKEPVIALALDSMEGSVVDQMLDAGRLPNLARLRERGVSAKVRCSPDGFLSMVWPTLFTGQRIGAHGWYFNKLWSPEEQLLRYVDASWLPARAFWEDLGPDFRVAIMDVPFSPTPPSGFNGEFLNGWQAHDDFGKLEMPSGLHRGLRRRYGPSAMGPEVFGPQSVGTLERQLREGVDSLQQFARILVDLLQRERWDMLLAAFGGPHRALHYLWSLDEADVSGAAPGRLERLRGARDEIYTAADRAIGTVLEHTPPDARVMVFALHGMGRNRGWAEHFPQIVSHLHSRGREGRAREGLVYRLKKALPQTWVRQVTTRLPASVNHGLVPLWSKRMLEWSSTRYFALPLDLNGYVRINVKGREARGIVEPGAELEELVEELTEDLLSLRDLRTGQPIVDRVDRVDDLVGHEAPRRYMLPDLVAVWSDTYAKGSPGVRSRYGETRWDPHSPLPSGRSGNHVQGGWLLAAGPDVPRATLSEEVPTVDLTPTLLEWLGAPIPERIEGSPVEALTRGRADVRV